MKIYIAGKMRGIKDFNKQAFYDAESYLISLGHDAVNPFAIDVEMGIDMTSPNGDTSDIKGFTQDSLKEIICRDVDALLECDAVYMLESWRDSKGAKAERAIAQWAGIEVLYQGENESWRG